MKCSVTRIILFPIPLYRMWFSFQYTKGFFCILWCHSCKNLRQQAFQFFHQVVSEGACFGSYGETIEKETSRSYFVRITLIIERHDRMLFVCLHHHRESSVDARGIPTLLVFFCFVWVVLFDLFEILIFINVNGTHVLY